MKYSLDFKQNVIATAQEKGNLEATALSFGIHKSTLLRWLTLEGFIEKPLILTRSLKIDKTSLELSMQFSPDLTLKERAKALNISRSALVNAMNRYNIKNKKSYRYVS